MSLYRIFLCYTIRRTLQYPILTGLLTLAHFAAAARTDVEQERLASALLDVLEETLQPEYVSLWLKPSAKRTLPR